MIYKRHAMKQNKKNRFKISLFFLIIFALFYSSMISAKGMAYLKIGITEALMITSFKGGNSGELGLTNGIVTDLGYKIPLDEKNELLFLYELNYDGPGLKGYSKESFNARNLDHFFVAKYFYRFAENLKFFAKADFFYEFYRIAKNEKWSDGLYNFGKTGGGVGMDYLITSNNLLNLSLETHYFWFPNYEDLSREAVYLLGEDQGSQLPTDSVNQNFIQYTVRLDDLWQIDKSFSIKASYLFNYRYYNRLTVDDKDLDPSNNKNQKDTQHNFQIDFSYSIAPEFLIELRYALTCFKSNYNYRAINDISSGSIKPDYFADFSSFHEHQFSLPLTWIISDRANLTLIPSYEYKGYKARPVKNSADGQFTVGTVQYNKAYSASLFWNYRAYENLSFIPQYVFKIAKSNNKDALSGYNYTAHYFGFQMVFEY